MFAVVLGMSMFSCAPKAETETEAPAAEEVEVVEEPAAEEVVAEGEEVVAEGEEAPAEEAAPAAEEAAAE